MVGGMRVACLRLLMRTVLPVYLLVIIVAIAWLATETYAVVRSDVGLAWYAYRSARAQAPDGEKSRILTFTAPYLEAVENPPQQELKGPILYLVTTQTCPNCAAAVGAWVKAIGAVDASGLSVWVVTDGDGSLESTILNTIRRPSVAVHISKITEPMRFMSFTGITAAPIGVAFRTSSQYVCAVVAVPPDDRASECVDALIRRTDFLTIPLFTRHGPVTPIKDPWLMKSASSDGTIIGHSLLARASMRRPERR